MKVTASRLRGLFPTQVRSSSSSFFDYAPWFFLRLWHFINHLLTYLFTASATKSFHCSLLAAMSLIASLSLLGVSWTLLHWLFKDSSCSNLSSIGYPVGFSHFADTDELFWWSFHFSHVVSNPLLAFICIAHHHKHASNALSSLTRAACRTATVCSLQTQVGAAAG